MAKNKRNRQAQIKRRRLQEAKLHRPLNLKMYDAPILGKVVAPVPDVEAARKLPLTQMVATCKKYKGVGLGANQVGLDARVVVIMLPNKDAFYLINPEITWVSDAVTKGPEGCLSYPGVSADIERHDEIEVTWRDLNWDEHHMKFKNFEARVIQHEIDHLDGICRVGDEWKRRKELASIEAQKTLAKIREAKIDSNVNGNA